MRVQIDIPVKGKDVWLAAFMLAHGLGVDFTLNDLCRVSGLKKNRHTREALAAMIAAGWLYRGKRITEQGRYPFIYGPQAPANVWERSA